MVDWPKREQELLDECAMWRERLAEAERLLKIVDDASRHADMGRYWVGLYYDECEAIRAFVRPTVSADVRQYACKDCGAVDGHYGNCGATTTVTVKHE